MIEQSIDNDFNDFKLTFLQSIKKYPAALSRMLCRPLKAVKSQYSESWVVLACYTFVTCFLAQMPWMISFHYPPYFLNTSFNFVFDAAVISFAIHLWTAAENPESDTFLPVFKSLLIAFMISTIYCLPLSFLAIRYMVMFAFVSQLMVGLKVAILTWLFYFVFRTHSHLARKHILTVSVLSAFFSSYIIPSLL